MRGKKSNQRFWRWGTFKIDVPDILYCVVVVGIVILSTSTTILLAQTEDASVPEEADSSDGMTDVSPAPKDELQPPEKSKTEMQEKIEPSIEVIVQREINEIRKKYLDHRAVWVEWWLTFITIVLGFFVVAITIFGFVSFREFRRLRDEAMKNVSEVKEIWDVAHMVQDRFEQAMQSAREELDAEATYDLSGNPRFEEALRYMQQLPYLSLVDRMIIEACQLQQRDEIIAAIRKWRSIVNDLDREDNNLAAVAWNSIGFLYLKRMNVDRAFSAFNKAIELRDDYVKAYVGRGTVKSLREQYESAIEDYSLAIDDGVDSDEVYFRRANAYNGLREYGNAIEDCDAAIRLNSIYTKVYIVRGEAKQGSGDFQAARDDFQYALRLATGQGQTDLIVRIEKRLQELNESG